MGYDQHTMCESCLGPEHAYAALSQQVACTHCARLPADDRKRRADALAAVAEEDDWPVQAFEPVDGGLMSLEPSAGQVSDDSYPASLHGSPYGSPLPPLPQTGETELEQGAGLADEHAVPFSVTTALPVIGGILGELPEIICKAAACRGLPVPPAQERCAPDDMTGVFSRVQTVRSDPVWPRFPAIRRYQEGAAAANPRTLKAPVATFVPLTKVEGFTDAGFPATPSLEPSLTAFFGVRQANVIAGRRPTLASPRDQYVARQADRVHQCAFQASAAANNIALLSNSVVTLVERSTTLAADEAEEIAKAASTALTLCASVAVSQARIAAWVTQIQRHLWLQQASVTETARKVLLDAPISPDGLFGPQFHAMVESMKAAAEQADDIRQHVSWLQPAGRHQHPQQPQRPTRPQRQAERYQPQPRRQRPSAAAGAPPRVSAPPPPQRRRGLSAVSQRGGRHSRSVSAPREPPRKQSRL